jgi:hypothetical protein
MNSTMMQPRSLLLPAFLFLGLVLQAQNPSPVQQRRLLLEYRTAVERADSMMNVDSMLHARSRLAAVVKPMEARRLHEEAAVIADTSGHSDRVLQALEALEQVHRAGSNWKEVLAVRERRAVVEEAMRQEQERLVEQAHEEEVRVLHQRNDSLLTAHQQAVAAVEQRAAEAQERALHVAYIALAVAVLAVVLVLFLLVRSGRARKRWEREVANLHGQLERSRTVRPKEPPVPAAEGRSHAPAVDPVVADPGPVVPPAADELVLGMLRKQAPQRLQTLREARAAGDAEKVARVVHSLRPQLTKLDEAYFAPLCAALMAPDAASDPVAWNERLDRFEQAVLKVIA